MAYFSNGTEGSILDNQCSECKLHKEPCVIAWVQMEYNYDQIGNKIARGIMDSLVHTNGTCLMKELIDKL